MALITSITMGAGIPTTLLLTLPYIDVVQRLRPFAAFFLFQDLLLFLIFTTAISIRYIRCPSLLPHTLKHPMMVRPATYQTCLPSISRTVINAQSAFTGCFPMTLGTLISGANALTQAYDMGSVWVFALSYW